MKTTFLALLIWLSASDAQSQIVIKGTLKDSKSKEFLSFVNIGVIGKNIGTVSNEEGKFSLTIPEKHFEDTLRFSMIGYKSKNYIVRDFIKGLSGKEIGLEPAIYELPDVVVSNKKLREKVLGNKTQSMSTTAGFTSGRLGNEVGMLIKIKRSPTFIKSFAASVATENNNPLRMRLNFYNVKNGMPGQAIHDRNIIVNAPIKSGKFEVDLSSYNIVAEDDFFVTLEWIENGSGRFFFSSSILGGSFVARETSQANWEKVGMFGVGFTVLAAY